MKCYYFNIIGQRKLKVKCVKFRKFDEETATICFLLSLHVNYGGLCDLIWIPHSPSLLVSLKTSESILNIKQLDCPHQASLVTWQFKMAANWQQNPPRCSHITMATILMEGNEITHVLIEHCYKLIYRLYVKLSSNIRMINKVKITRHWSPNCWK